MLEFQVLKRPYHLKAIRLKIVNYKKLYADALASMFHDKQNLDHWSHYTLCCTCKGISLAQVYEASTLQFIIYDRFL